MTPPFSAVTAETAWRRHLIDDDAGIRALLERTKRIAVLGIKTPETGQPAYYVADYAHRAGYEVILTDQPYAIPLRLAFGARERRA